MCFASSRLHVHSRTGNFLLGRGVVKHLPKHFPAQVVQISTKQSKRNEGHMMR